jgi:hypothetical protein
MRISTQMMYEQSMRGVTNSQSLWLGYGEQMSTGKRVNRPSDDPIAASQAVVLSQANPEQSVCTGAYLRNDQSLSGRERVDAGDIGYPERRKRSFMRATAR